MAKKTEERKPLSSFEGEDVLSATVAVVNAGDGLSRALGVHPVELHRGDKVHVVLECEVDRIMFRGIKDTQALTRVHVLKAGSATLVNEDLVRQALDETTEAIERAEGIVRLPFGAEDDGAPDPEEEPSE